MRSTRVRINLPFGFSLIELLASAVILSILAVMGVPYAQTAKDRQVELQLKESLLKLRLAIDSYAYNEYPEQFARSVDGDVIRGEDGVGDPDGDGIADDDGDGEVDEDGAPLFPKTLDELVTKGYLPNIPRDPLSSDPSSPATWTLQFVDRKFSFVKADGTPDSVTVRGILDIHSRARGTGLTGTRFDSW
jgi:prepilin-type N-terminal cleavage/methylation domain-containing protein